MKAVVAAFNQEKALVGAFSVITNLRMELFQALPGMHSHRAPQSPEIRQKLTQTPLQLQPVSSPRPGLRRRRQQSGYILHFTQPGVIAPPVCMTRLSALSSRGQGGQGRPHQHGARMVPAVLVLVSAR